MPKINLKEPQFFTVGIYLIFETKEVYNNPSRKKKFS